MIFLQVEVYQADGAVPVGDVTGSMPLQVKKTSVRYCWIAHWNTLGKWRAPAFVRVGPKWLSSGQHERGDTIRERMKSPSRVNHTVADQRPEVAGVISSSPMELNRMTLELGPEWGARVLGVVADEQVAATGKDLPPRYL